MFLDAAIKYVEGMRQTLLDSSKGLQGNKTVVVHPQVAADFDEAKTLSKDWKAREKRQIMDNITRMGRK
jgi:hypothetical protein